MRSLKHRIFERLMAKFPRKNRLAWENVCLMFMQCAPRRTHVCPPDSHHWPAQKYIGPVPSRAREKTAGSAGQHYVQKKC
jgi:hypothetical protein